MRDAIEADEAGLRAIVVVSPNNPTGSYLKRDELSAMAATGLPIVSDEVFAHYGFGEDPRRAMSALEVADEASLVFALGGLSKLAALPQMKVAWTAIAGADARAVNDATLERLRAHRGQLSLRRDTGAVRPPDAARDPLGRGGGDSRANGGEPRLVEGPPGDGRRGGHAAPL